MSFELITPKIGDIGHFQVRRSLPSARRRMVGPFVFWDEMGPASFAPGHGLDVRPHPHIGLATVTYLFEGVLMHRDSLGVVAEVRGGDVNVMAAGKGIVHSERTGEAERAAGHRLHGIQAWLALPDDMEESEPQFEHRERAYLPVIEEKGVRAMLILGTAYGRRSPARVFSPTMYLDLTLEAGAGTALPPDHAECAVYAVEGEVALGGEAVSAGHMAVLDAGARPPLVAKTKARVMVLGGDPLGTRHITWNFVSHSKERIDRAKEDWRASIRAEFGGSVFRLPPGESEYIPLPEDQAGPPDSTEECPTT